MFYNMDNSTYRTNSNEATLRDTGPFKILNSDMGIKGQKTFAYKNVVTTKKVGQKIKIGDKIVQTIIQDPNENR